MYVYVPLSQRSPARLRAQAAAYREMAATARSPEAKNGLEKLVVRLARLADQREAAAAAPSPARGGSGHQAG